MSKKYDFSGYATKNDILCSDGRTIRHNAFVEQDGAKVPLVWMHGHDDPDNVLGHAILENRDDGVYMYGYFNGTPKAEHTKMAVQHGDIDSVSIWANRLKQKGGDVVHGVIREVSLVLSPANPGARITPTIIAHSDDMDEFDATIFFDERIICHSDSDDDEDEDEKKKKETESEDDKDKDSDSKEEEKDEDPEEKEDKVEHSDNEGEAKMAENERTVQDVYDEMTDEQKNVCNFLVGMALQEAGVTDDGEVEHSDDEGDSFMARNVFDTDIEERNDVLSHDEMMTIIKDGKKLGSLKESFLSHADEYGIEDIEMLFPEYKNLNNPPEFVQRDTGWVGKWMSGVTHSPFSRIKSQFANITEDEARAKGYMKTHLKKEEVFTLLRRTTDPQTVYKKQKLDRDDTIDITDFDVVAWLKVEMRFMLEEELARAMLIGDGRSSSDEDKIQEVHVRPVVSDEDFFTIKVPVDASGDNFYKNIIAQSIRGRKTYKGSGSPTLWTTEDYLSELLLLEDGIGHRLYKTEAELATAMRVKDIVTVEVMEGQTVKVNNADVEVIGVIVNPADYRVGADKGGQTSLFEDFDIDYNQMKYLIETRISGALTKPFSAIVLYKDTTGSAQISKWRDKHDGTTANGYGVTGATGATGATGSTGE